MRHDDETPRKGRLPDPRERLRNGVAHARASPLVESEEHDPRVPPRREAADVSQPFVERQQDPISLTRGCGDSSVCRSPEPFAVHGVDVVTQHGQVVNRLGGETLVELEAQDQPAG